jgi:hypothetical protein
MSYAAAVMDIISKQSAINLSRYLNRCQFTAVITQQWLLPAQAKRRASTSIRSGTAAVRPMPRALTVAVSAAGAAVMSRLLMSTRRPGATAPAAGVMARREQTGSLLMRPSSTGIMQHGFLRDILPCSAHM